MTSGCSKKPRRSDSGSDKNRECVGQGVANFVTGFLGAMGGCAMIGQSVINVSAGARTRLSTFCAGVFLLFFIVVLGDWVKQIPMAALVAVVCSDIADSGVVADVCATHGPLRVEYVAGQEGQLRRLLTRPPVSHSD